MFRFYLFFYQCLSIFFIPIILLIFFLKKKCRGLKKDLLGRFLGIPVNLPNEHFQKGKVYWVHSVSLGETQAVYPLVKEIEKRDYTSRIVWTVSTKTAWYFLQCQINSNSDEEWNKIVVELIPYDFKWSVEMFIDVFKPSVLILVETEVWPNLIASCSKVGIRICLVNGRLSKKSFMRYGLVRNFCSPVLNMIHLLVAQTEVDKKRFKELGYEKDILVLKNMKFDIPIVKDQVRAGSTIRENIKKHIVWLALSTREGEERELLQCWQDHHKNNGNDLMIIVPRHPERFEQVYKWARETMLKVEYRSYLFEKSSFLSKDSPSIIIGNTLGEVQMYLSLSDIVLIGGSVKNSGGQSPLDAARLGKAIFFGHYMNNFSEISEQLLLQRSAIQIGTYKEWFFRGQTLFNSEKDFRQLCTGASRFVNSNMGSTRKYAELIVKKT